jgi:hypothetical protein
VVNTVQIVAHKPETQSSVEIAELNFNFFYSSDPLMVLTGK